MDKNDMTFAMFEILHELYCSLIRKQMWDETNKTLEFIGNPIIWDNKPLKSLVNEQIIFDKPRGTYPPETMCISDNVKYKIESGFHVPSNYYQVKSEGGTDIHEAGKLFSTQSQIEHDYFLGKLEYSTGFFNVPLPFLAFAPSIKSNRVSAINVSMDFGSSSSKHKYVFNFINCKSCINFEGFPASGKRWANKLRRKGWKRSGKDWYCPNCDEYRVANNE